MKRAAALVFLTLLLAGAAQAGVSIGMGGATVESGLVFKQRLSEAEILVPADTFRDGEAHTWSIRQVYDRGDKSRENFSSFRVRKPGPVPAPAV